MSDPSSAYHKETRTQFQIDRIAFFSDAVIAIAITLMILEIKIPPLGRDATSKEILTKYGGSMILHLLALFICFLTIGNLWIRHHELYEHIVNYNKKLIRANLFFLLSIIMLPVSISFLFEPDNPVQLQMMVFFINLSLCNLTYYIMLRVIFSSKNRFSSVSGDEIVKKNKRIALRVTLMFLLVIFLIGLGVSWFYFPFIIWPIAARIVEKIGDARKKNKTVVKVV